MKRNNNIIKIFALIALQFLMINNVYAAGFFTPSDGDVSVTVLKELFGGLMGGGADPLQNAIKIFNSSILIVGGILVAYTIVMGTVGTAHEGEMMGKKFSSVWVPIRTALGTALVLPTINGAYCLMQAIVMWLVLQGVGLADAVWNAYIEQATTTSNIRATMKGQDQITKLAEDIFQMHVCVQANKQALKKVASETPQFESWATKFQYKHGLLPSVSPKDKEKIWAFGDFQKSFIFSSESDCGNVKILVAPPENANNTTSGKLSSFEAKIRMPSLEPIYKAHENATKAMITSLESEAETFVQKVLAETGNEKPKINYSKITEAAKAYENTIIAAGQSFITEKDPFDYLRTTANAEGWFMAGSWFIKLININATTNTSINNIPKGSVSQDVGGRHIGNMVKNVYSAMESSLAEISPDKRVMSNHTEEKENQRNESGFSSKITNFAVGIDLVSLKEDNRHPIVIIQDMGNSLMVSYGVLMGVAVGAAGLIGLALTSGVVMGMTVLAMMIPVFITMVFLGFFLGYFLPMLPFMIWIGALTGWLIMVVEAIIAAPLWAVMHLHPSGDDATGKGGSGYMLVLGLLLRPTLMVFGFIASVALLQVMGEFVNKVFFDVFIMSQSSSLGLMGSLFGALIYAAVMYQLIKTMLTVIHVLPDQLLRWIGGGSEQLGQYAGQMNQGSQAAYALIANKAIGDIGQMPKQALDLGAQMKNLKQQKLSLANEQKQTEMMKQNQNDQLDRDFGAGTSDEKDRLMGTGKDTFATQKDNTSFRQGIETSMKAGGEMGRENFIAKMTDAKANNFRDYGGSSANAAKEIGNEVANEQMLQNIQSKFGEDAIEKLGLMKHNEDGSQRVDSKKLNNLNDAITKYESQIGEFGLSKAIEKTKNEISPESSGMDMLKNLSQNVKQIKSYKDMQDLNGNAASVGPSSSSPLTNMQAEMNNLGGGNQTINNPSVDSGFTQTPSETKNIESDK